MPEDIELDGNEETFKVKVIYETRELYGMVQGERDIVIFRN